MKLKKSDITKIVVAFALSFLFLFTALYSYRESYEYIYELTFISNFSTGVFLLVAGITGLCNRALPQFLFLDFTLLLLIVFGVSLFAFADFNFEGGFLFLHAINPPLMLAYYLFFTNQPHTKWQLISTVLILPAIYLIFAVVYGMNTGNYIYFFLNYKEYGVGYTILFVFGILIGLVAVSTGIYFLNKVIHKRFLKNI